MNESQTPDSKAAKKLAKAAAKTAKKLGKAEKATAAQQASAPPATGSESFAERGVRATERKLTLERWRMVIAGLGVLVGLATLLVALRGGC